MRFRLVSQYVKIGNDYIINFSSTGYIHVYLMIDYPLRRVLCTHKNYYNTRNIKVRYDLFTSLVLL